MILAGGCIAILLPGSADSDGKQAPAWVALIGVAMIIVGIVVTIFAKNRSITIQRGGNTTIINRRILGGKSQAQTIPTANIVAVRLSTYADTSGQDANGNPTNNRRSVLALVLNNNDLVQISNSGSNGFQFNGLNIGSLIQKAPLSKEANQLATFLGVPLQADDTSSILGAVQSVKSAFSQSSPQPPQAPAQSAPFNPTPQQPQQPAIPLSSAPPQALGSLNSQPLPPQTPASNPPAPPQNPPNTPQ